MRLCPRRVHRSSLLAPAFLLALVTIQPLWAAADEPESASDTKQKSSSATRVAGILEAVTSAEIMADTEHLDSLMIKRILPHGTVVSRGENLVWFDREDVDKKIKEAEVALRLSKLALQGDIFDHEQFLQAQTLDKEAAERSRKIAQQEFDNFADVDREMQVKDAGFRLKSAQASLENSLEELNQLEQMYKEDDLTEESEEIVLKRAKQAVESAQFRLESTEVQSQRTVDQTIPTQTASQQAALSRAEMAYQKAIHSLNLARQRRDIELAQTKDKLAEQEQDLAELKEERHNMVLTSPMDGIVLHGKLNQGRLADKPSTLEADSKVTANQVLITVVSPTKLQIRAQDLDESKLAVVTEGAKCKVVIKAFPDLQATGTVKSRSMVPFAANKYDCVVALHVKKDGSKLLPTMGCDLEFEQAAADTDDAAADKPEKSGSKDSEKEGEHEHEQERQHDDHNNHDHDDKEQE